MTADELLDALCAAAEDGDVEALLYLPAFERWLGRPEGRAYCANTATPEFKGT